MVEYIVAIDVTRVRFPADALYFSIACYPASDKDGLLVWYMLCGDAGGSQAQTNKPNILEGAGLGVD